ncbi:unnamed protein product [Phytophthora fragariaefolia]|uniref:Unnamed protein product n=1 Tax=Phytophthora fragariaefolia TaxID=1490495 RepID=A0A9W6WW63_9STRA|nr:unnamed protein product [Phytophthora fragariaefolia]
MHTRRESSHSRASTASDTTSDIGRNRSKGSRSKASRSDAEGRRASTSSHASTSSRTSTCSRTSDNLGDDDDGSSHRRHHRHHRKKSGDDDKRERSSSSENSKPKSGKRDPMSAISSAEAEVRLADPTG